MIRHMDAIFSHGVFFPLEPLTLPEGTHVHLSVEDGIDINSTQRVAKVITPRLAHPKDAADFVMEIR
jgi:predicted DNA-binding antitoxin AbrB/MazE fold protein